MASPAVQGPDTLVTSSGVLARRRVLLGAGAGALLLSIGTAASCKEQIKPQASQDQALGASAGHTDLSPAGKALDDPRAKSFLPRYPIGEQVLTVARRTFQDSRGNLWFGGDGASRYDGESLEHFPVNEEFGVSIRGMTEDQAGNVWFATSGGLSKYDGESFTRFTEADGLASDGVWSIAIDRSGTIWAGTLEGVSRLNGDVFTPFDIPEAEPDLSGGFASGKVIRSIMEDSRGRMWFGTNGGAYVYDGESLTNISEQDGLCNNSVNAIREDKKGRFWFATHHQGVCRMEGTSFTHVTKEDGVIGTEAWDIYEDRSGNIWFPMENSGVYRYDGESFANFHTEEGLDIGAVQSTYEDKEGRLWAGGAGGLYRYDGRRFINVTKNGPWTSQR